MVVGVGANFVRLLFIDPFTMTLLDHRSPETCSPRKGIVAIEQELPKMKYQGISSILMYHSLGTFVSICGNSVLTYFFPYKLCRHSPSFNGKNVTS